MVKAHTAILKSTLLHSLLYLLLGVVTLTVSLGFVLFPTRSLNQLGQIEETVRLSGSSMYPTFPKPKGKTATSEAREIVATPAMLIYPSGLEIYHQRYFDYRIQKGDIVLIFNQKTKEITKKLDGRETIGKIVMTPDLVWSWWI